MRAQSHPFASWCLWVWSFTVLDLQGGFVTNLLAQNPPAPRTFQTTITFGTPQTGQARKPITLVPAVAAPGALLECPDHNRVLVLNQTGTDTIGVTNYSIPGPLTLTPEYHDCQRFPIQGGEFGTLAAVFAGHGQHLENPPLMQSPDSAVALVVSDSYYATLGIGPGNNCLYMWGPTDSVQSAVMLYVGGDERSCKRSIDPKNHRGRVLHVIKQELPAGLTGPLPKGARWDLDPVSFQAYVSIRCGTGWCEVGPTTGWESSDTYDVGQPNRRRAVHGIKGWYDEQPLPRYAPAATVAASLAGFLTPPPPRLVPSITGTIVPDTSLQSNPGTSYFDYQWRQTGTVHLWERSTDYEDLYGFQSRVFPDAVNILAVCRDPATDSPGRVCEGLPANIRERCRGDGEATWYARITPADRGRPRYRCVTYQRHKQHGPAFTARWRWFGGAVLPQRPTPPRSVIGIGMPIWPELLEILTPPWLAAPLQSGGYGVGIWHWCPDGCCTY